MRSQRPQLQPSSSEKGATTPVRPGLLASLTALYVAQGVPFGLAAEYLPVVLRRAGLGMGAIASTFWLQLPWQAKVLWARLADTPEARRKARLLIFVIQVALAVAVGAHAGLVLPENLRVWLILTLVCAVLASSQDVFVDALAVRTLKPSERGYGNIAQVAGYRAGMLLGGGGLLLAGALLGAQAALLALGGVVAALAAFAFVAAKDDEPKAYRTDESAAYESAEVAPTNGVDDAKAPPFGDFVRSLFAPDAWRVLALAGTFKLGIHIASPLIKPMVVDGGFSNRDVGLAVVTVGTIASFVGAAVGGLLHRRTGEPFALGVSCVLHAVTTAPLAWLEHAGVPFAPAVACIGAEHFASGVGTTVLFAALMSATRPTVAGFHYTILTSLNALTIGVGGTLGGFVADRVGRPTTYELATVVSLLPLLWVRRWEQARDASALRTLEPSSPGTA